MTGVAKPLNIIDVRLDAEPVLIRIPLGHRSIPFTENAERANGIEIDAGV